MLSAFELFDQLRAMGEPTDPDDVFAAELTFVDSVPGDVVSAAIRDILQSEIEPELDPSSGLDDELDDSWFVVLPGLPSYGFEGLGFALARALGREVEILLKLTCLEGNFLPVDSLFGAPAAFDVKLASGVCDTPRTAKADSAWPHREARISAAWIHHRGQGVSVASIDTGYSDHPDLAGIVDLQHQINVIERHSPHDARDRFNSGAFLFPGHGTTTKSVIASRGDVDAGWAATGLGDVTGAAPEAMIIPVRATKSVIMVLQRNLPRAIQAAVGAGSDVICMCLGGPTVFRGVQKALKSAVEAGIVVVAAAGNCYPQVVFPAAYSRQGLSVGMGAWATGAGTWATV